jgi:hypothetical protein
MRLYVFFLNQLQHPNPNFFYNIQLNLFLQKKIDNGLGNMNKMKFNIKEVRYTHSKFMQKSYVAKKIESRANRENDWFSGVPRASPSLWFSPSLDSSWCISSSPYEKTSTQNFLPSLFCGVTLVGIKGRMLTARNFQTKLHIKCPASIQCCMLSHKLKSIKNIQLQSLNNANRTESVQKIAAEKCI